MNRLERRELHRANQQSIAQRNAVESIKTIIQEQSAYLHECALLKIMSIGKQFPGDHHAQITDLAWKLAMTDAALLQAHEEIQAMREIMGLV